MTEISKCGIRRTNLAIAGAVLAAVTLAGCSAGGSGSSSSGSCGAGAAPPAVAAPAAGNLGKAGTLPKAGKVAKTKVNNTNDLSDGSSTLTDAVVGEAKDRTISKAVEGFASHFLGRTVGRQVASVFGEANDAAKAFAPAKC